MSHHHEHQSRQPIDARIELQNHIAGLDETIHDINDFRLRTRVGKTGVSGISIPSMHDGEYGNYSFAETAKKFARRTDIPKTPDQRMYADLLAIMPAMVAAKELLNDEEEEEREHHSHGYDHNYRHDYDHNEDHYEAKLQMAKFNEVIRNIIDTHPRIQATTIVGLVRSVSLRYGFDADQVNTATEDVNIMLYGAKHELAYEAALHRLPLGFEVIPTDAEDDKHGADMLVLCPNGVVVSIDVKSTRKAAMRGQEKQERYHKRTHTHMPRNEIIVFSGFRSEDFHPDNPWRPTDEAIERVLPAIETRLYQAAGMHTHHRTGVKR